MSEIPTRRQFEKSLGDTTAKAIKRHRLWPLVESLGQAAYDMHTYDGKDGLKIEGVSHFGTKSNSLYSTLESRVRAAENELFAVIVKEVT